MSDRRIRFIHGASEEEQAAAAVLLDEQTIEIALPSGTPCHAHQLLVLALVDLLGRIFPRIDVRCDPDAPASSALPPGPDLLSERLATVRTHGIGAGEAGPPAVRLAIGESVTDQADLWGDGCGWQSYIGTEPSRLPVNSTDLNPLGPLIAASRLAAHAFALLLTEYLKPAASPTSIYSSALDYSTGRDPLPPSNAPLPSMLEAALVGAGSVGGASVYALARLPQLAGSLAVIDPQSLERANPDRALLATSKLAAAGEPKAEAATAALAHHGSTFDVTPHRASVSEYLAGRPREEPVPLILCAVDSPKSRRSVQDCLPLDVVNAACSPREVTVSGHRTGADACVSCLQMESLLDSERIRWRLIAAATGWPRDRVITYMIGETPLQKLDLRDLELRRKRPEGSLAAYEGVTLEELWRAEFIYGETKLSGASGAAVAVAAPWVTALAGFLLSAEALKHGSPELRRYCLGALGQLDRLKWEENVYASPGFGLLTSPPRWAGKECLCRSPRRRRLLMARYDLSEEDYLP